MPNLPFDVKREDRKTVLVFAEDVTEQRTEEAEETLSEELSRCDTLVVNLTGTKTLGSQWWRYIGRLGLRAKEEGQRVVIVGARETLRSTADAVAVSGHLEWVDSITDVKP